MSGNGKQVQLAPNQNQRYPSCMPNRPITPQRTDNFPVASGGVNAGYAAPNPAGGHHTIRAIPQAPTPPQDIKQTMYPQQNIRSQQYPPQQQFRSGPPQQPANVIHHQSRLNSHHRQQVSVQQTPAPAAWNNRQQMMCNLPTVFLPHLNIAAPAAFPPQQTMNAQYYSPQSQHSMSMIPQQYYCQQPQQFPWPANPPGRGGPSPAQMAPTQNIAQPQTVHSYVPRYPSHMSHSVTYEKKNRSHAIPIIDPKSGKQVNQDDLVNTSNDSGVQLPQQDENGLSAVEEFGRHISQVSTEKEEEVIKHIDSSPHSEDGYHEPDDTNQELCNEMIAGDSCKSEAEYVSDKSKHNPLCELNETPVVSAISNSPEIVPKQCHVTKQKQIEIVSSENKKNQMTKVGNKVINNQTSDLILTDDTNLIKNETITDPKECDPQKILTSALQSQKSVDEGNKIDTSDISRKTQISTAEIIPANLPVESESKIESDIIVCSKEPNAQKTENIQLEPIDSQENYPVQQLTTSLENVRLEVSSVTSEQSKVDTADSNLGASVHSGAEVSDVPKLEQLSFSNKVDNYNVPQDVVVASEASESCTIIQDTSEISKENIANSANVTPVHEIESSLTNNESVPDTVEDSSLKDCIVENQELSIEKVDEKSKGPVLRYTYKEDQWSPLNTSGKKCYDTDFLMALKYDPNSKKKPEISQLDILADNLNRQPRNTDATRSESMPRNNLLPGFAKGSTHNATPNRKSQHGKPIKDPKGIPPMGQGVGRPMHVSLSLKSDVKLNESENAWKPTRMRQENLSDEEIQTRELCKAFISTLNKITPQNFDALIAQIRKLNIDTLDRFTKIIHLVFEKAIDEPNFSLTYANMCKELASITLSSSEKCDETFRTLIVKKCQYEFEKNDDTVKKMQKEVDECTDPEKKKQLLLNLEETESKTRRRSVGNVRFIGEIFKQKLITEKVVFGCIEHLLGKAEEETLECLCKLLTTIGKDLEKRNETNLQPYFNRMSNIIETKRKELSSRVRFMIQDVIDLRLNNWKPRLQAANPKTMEQIKLEVELEQNRPPVLSNYGTPSSFSRKDDRPINMNKRGGSKSVTEDGGWSTAASRNSKTKTTFVDKGKLSKMISFTPVTQTTLHPSSQSLITWSKGSTINKKPDSPQTSSHKPSSNSSGINRKPMTETSNTYLPLDKESQYSEVSSSNSDTPARKVGYKSKGASIERSTFKSGDSEEQGDNSFSDSSEKIKVVLDYAHTDTVYGMLDRIQDNIKNNEDIPNLCRELILWGINYKVKSNMEIIGEVTGTLVDDGFITSEEFLKVLKETMDGSAKAFQKGEGIWKMLGGFIWAHMNKNNLTLDQIYVAFSKAIELEYGFNLLSAIFMEKLKEAPEDIKNLWLKSSLTLVDWMDEEYLIQFSEELSWSWIYQEKVSTHEDVCAQMLKLMQEGKSRDELKMWIEKNVGRAVNNSWFVRTLTEAIHTYGLCCEEGLRKPTLEASRLEKFYPLLSSYICSKEKHELECLFAIQHLINKYEHPQGITRQLFDYIWDYGDIVSLEAINSWEKNTDPKEQEGKGVMLKTLTSFLTSIKSDDHSSEDANSIICEEEY